MATKFEWNKSKARDNYKKHGVSFELATEVFKDPFALDFIDDRQDYGEERFVTIGMAKDHILYVAYTERDEDVIRIISARKATSHEEQTYLDQNS